MSVKVFLHGLEGSSQGTKSVFFKEWFPEMIIPDFEGSLKERMLKLRKVLSGNANISLVGSSFGGLMATLFAFEEEERVDRLILLAPALNLMCFTLVKKMAISIPVMIFHGRDDKVIPIRPIEQISDRIFQDLTFNIVDDDHSLHSTFKKIGWEEILSS